MKKMRCLFGALVLFMLFLNKIEISSGMSNNLKPIRTKSSKKDQEKLNKYGTPRRTNEGMPKRDKKTDERLHDNVVIKDHTDPTEPAPPLSTPGFTLYEEHSQRPGYVDPYIHLNTNLLDIAHPDSFVNLDPAAFTLHQHQAIRSAMHGYEGSQFHHNIDSTGVGAYGSLAGHSSANVPLQPSAGQDALKIHNQHSDQFYYPNQNLYPNYAAAVAQEETNHNYHQPLNQHRVGQYHQPSSGISSDDPMLSEMNLQQASGLLNHGSFQGHFEQDASEGHRSRSKGLANLESYKNTHGWGSSGGSGSGSGSGYSHQK